MALANVAAPPIPRMKPTSSSWGYWVTYQTGAWEGIINSSYGAGYVYWIQVHSKNNTVGEYYLKDDSTTLFVIGLSGDQYDEFFAYFDPPIYFATNITLVIPSMGYVNTCISWGSI